MRITKEVFDIEHEATDTHDDSTSANEFPAKVPIVSRSLTIVPRSFVITHQVSDRIAFEQHDSVPTPWDSKALETFWRRSHHVKFRFGIAFGYSAIAGRGIGRVPSAHRINELNYRSIRPDRKSRVSRHPV